MATTPATSAAPASTPIPKSYAKGVAMTADPWEGCARLEYGGDRSLARSIEQQVAHTPPEGHARLEPQLLAALATPGCTDAGRAFVCEMLAIAGSARSVPALAALLRNTASVEAARFALDAISGPEAGAALREALGGVTGNAKAGLIGSIAARGDRTALPALKTLAANPTETPLVREAAARALAALTET